MIQQQNVISLARVSGTSLVAISQAWNLVKYRLGWKILILMFSSMFLSLSSCKDLPKNMDVKNDSVITTTYVNIFTLKDTMEFDAGPNSFFGSRLFIVGDFIDTILSGSQVCSALDSSCLYQKIKQTSVFEFGDSILWPSLSNLVYYSQGEKVDISKYLKYFNDSMSAYSYDPEQKILAYYGIKDNYQHSTGSSKSISMDDSVRFSIYAGRFNVVARKNDAIEIYADGINSDSYGYFFPPEFLGDSIVFKKEATNEVFKIPKNFNLHKLTKP